MQKVCQFADVPTNRDFEYGDLMARLVESENAGLAIGDRVNVETARGTTDRIGDLGVADEKLAGFGGKVDDDRLPDAPLQPMRDARRARCLKIGHFGAGRWRAKFRREWREPSRKRQPSGPPNARSDEISSAVSHFYFGERETQWPSICWLVAGSRRARWSGRPTCRSRGRRPKPSCPRRPACCAK